MKGQWICRNNNTWVAEGILQSAIEFKYQGQLLKIDLLESVLVFRVITEVRVGEFVKKNYGTLVALCGAKMSNMEITVTK